MPDEIISPVIATNRRAHRRNLPQAAGRHNSVKFHPAAISGSGPAPHWLGRPFHRLLEDRRGQHGMDVQRGGAELRKTCRRAGGPAIAWPGGDIVGWSALPLFASAPATLNHLTTRVGIR